MAKLSTLNLEGGSIYLLGAFLTWGFVPIYWKHFNFLSYYELLAHRVFWAFCFILIYVFIKNEFGEVLKILKNKKAFILFIISTSLITFNWNLYLWAVQQGYIVEGSLGYFLNPILNVFIGVIFLSEKLKFTHWFAVILALIALVILFTQNVGRPLISVGLALSFALYGLIRKLSPVKAYLAQLLETSLMMPFVLIYFFYLIKGNQFHFYTIKNIDKILLMVAGPVTILPLIWFTKGVQSTPLSIVGLFQYIAPSLQLIVGVFLYNENFGEMHLYSFGLIWIGLIVYSIDQIIKYKNNYAK